MHDNKRLVAEILSKPKEEQDKAFEKLRLRGNFEHNLRVIDQKEGILLVKRKSAQPKTYEDYLPCFHCLAFIEIKGLWHHVKKCEDYTEDDDNETEYSIVERSRMLLSGSVKAYKSDNDNYKNLKMEVLRKMHNGTEKEVIQNDDLILKFGSVLLERAGERRRHYIASRMRQLSKVVQTLRVTKKEYAYDYLTDFLVPERFDDLINATLELSGDATKKTVNGVKMLKTPSFGLHVGHSLRKCAMVKLGQALRVRDKYKEEEARTFEELLSKEWTDLISSKALQTLKERSYYKEQEIPETEDLIKLTKYTKERVDRGVKVLTQDATTENWHSLAKSVFVAATLFNQRRGGEVAEMPLHSFTGRPDPSRYPNGELLKSLTTLERKLLSR